MNKEEKLPQHSTAGLACLGHLKVPNNSHKAKAYMYDTQPYTAALEAL